LKSGVSECFVAHDVFLSDLEPLGTAIFFPGGDADAIRECEALLQRPAREIGSRLNPIRAER
jgi:hypothetical protein